MPKNTFLLTSPLNGSLEIISLRIFNIFIEIKFSYHIIHLFKVYNSLFLIYSQDCGIIMAINLRTLSSSQKEISCYPSKFGTFFHCLFTFSVIEI